MKTQHRIMTSIAAKLMIGGAAALMAAGAFAHCDTTRGPIIPEAQAALEKGDVTPVLKWVKPEHEAEIKTAFAKAVGVRSKGDDVKALADQYFLETLIRIHRAGEGAPFTGIKDDPVGPFVAMVDATLDTGSPDDLIGKMSAHMGAIIREKFAKAAEARKDKDKSVEAGRKFVEAYVVYVHYLEGVHDAIMAAGAHSHTKPEAAEGQHRD
jgi:hypothetical protein